MDALGYLGNYQSFFGEILILGEDSQSCKEFLHGDFELKFIRQALLYILFWY